MEKCKNNPWENVNIPVLNPQQNVEIGTQRQNVAINGNIFMLWAKQNGGEKEESRREKGGKGGGKIRGKERKDCIYLLCCQFTVRFVCSTNI